MPKPPQSNTGPFGIPPGGPWFAYALTGTIQKQSNPVLAAGLANAGWVGFKTQAEAKLFIAQSPATGVKNANPVKPITDLVDFFTNPNSWVRIGEVFAGAILLYAGITAILKVQPVKTGVKAAGKAVML